VITFKLFLESKELAVHDVRPLGALELLDHGSRGFELHHIGEMRSVLIKYGKGFIFAKRMLQHLDELLASHDKMLSAGDRLQDKHADLKNGANDLKAAFLSGDRGAMRKHKKALDAHIDDLDHHVNAPGSAHRAIENEFTESPSVFGSTRLMQRIGSDELTKVKALDFSKTLFTNIDFPHGASDSIDHALYFLLQLSESPKTRRVTDASDLRQHSKIKYATDKGFNELMRLMEQYLHSNDKTLIPRIVELINANPALKAANEKAKLKVKTVYRGLGFSEDDNVSQKKVMAGEKKRKYVATSISRHAAKNFALQKGHLEDEDSRRSEVGVMLTYSVTPAAIVFDTRVLDVAYGESEILIDATKAKLTNFEEL
jgi:hypothetical protein